MPSLQHLNRLWVNQRPSPQNPSRANMPQKPSCMHYASGVHDVRADASHHNGTVEGKTAVTALISAKSLSDCQPPLILALPGTLRGMQPMTACAALVCQINVVTSPSCGCDHHILSCTCHSHIKLQHQILRCAKCWDPSKLFLTLKVALSTTKSIRRPQQLHTKLRYHGAVG